MKFLQAITADGNIEFFNVDNILTIRPYANGCTKILMGAGLYWDVKTDTIVFVALENLPTAVMEA